MNALINQLLVQIQIGVGQSRLAPLDQHAVQALYGQQRLEDLALNRDLILGGKEQGSAAVRGEDRLHSLEDPGEDIVVDIGGNHCDSTVQEGLRFRAFPQAGTAALPAGNQALILQHRQGPADRLPADLKALTEQVLCGKKLLAAVYAAFDLLPQRVGDELIFRSHRRPPLQEILYFLLMGRESGPFPPDYCGIIAYLIDLYNSKKFVHILFSASGYAEVQHLSAPIFFAKETAARSI